MRDLQRIYEREAEYIEGLALGWREEVDPSKLDEETRRRLLQLVLAKGITYRELGLDRTYFYRIRTGKYRITDNVLRRLLEHISEDEFRRVVGTKTLLSIPVRTISIAYSGCMLYESLPFHITDIRAKTERSAISVIHPDIYGSPDIEALILQCPTDKFLKELGLINRVIRDPEGEGVDQVVVIERFLNRAFRELSRSKIRKLISNRERRLKRAGIIKGKGGSLIKRYIERPIKKAFKRRGQDGYLSLFHRYEKSYEDLLSRKLSASGMSNASKWIEKIIDPGSFYELFRDFKAERFLDEDMVSRAYLEELRELGTAKN